MRRSFGPMGGAGGGGGMMRTVHRAVRAGSGGRGSSEEPFYHSTTNHNSRPTYKPSSSDNHNNSNTLSLSPNHQLSAVTHLNGDEYDDFVFCSVPSVDEVHHAVSSLQQVLDPAISYEDWIEPSTSMLQSQSVYDAFRLLQTEPSVKKMVISLSSDKSVWEAVMNNEAVRELRDSIYEANKSILDKLESSNHGSIPVLDVIKWIFNNTKAKMMEIIEKTTKLFQSPRNENKTDVATEKKLATSFMLSVIIILIVVVTRVSRS